MKRKKYSLTFYAKHATEAYDILDEGFNCREHGGFSEVLPLWIVVYNHRYGTASYLLRSEKRPTQKQLIAGCCNFEQDRGESIESFSVGVDEPFTIEAWKELQA